MWVSVGGMAGRVMMNITMGWVMRASNAKGNCSSGESMALFNSNTTFTSQYSCRRQRTSTSSSLYTLIELMMVVLEMVVTMMM